MQNAWNRFKDNAPALSVLLAILLALGAATHFAVLNPIHQQFSAMNQRFDDMNQRFGDMNQRFGDMNQRFDDMNQRFDGLKTDLSTRLDAQDKYINERFDAQDAIARERFLALTQRLDRLENDVSELRGLSDRVSENTIRIDAIESQLTTADTPSPAD